MSEPNAHRLKRLKMRSMRRGIKEMDLILSTFADRRLDGMSSAELDLYGALLTENDQDLYQWVTGQTHVPDPFGALIGEIVQTFQN